MTQLTVAGSGPINPFVKAAEFWTRPDYSREVAAWASYKLNVDLWSLQREIARTSLVKKRTLVRSCHASGKTFLAAVLCCHHIDVHRVGTARVISTAPTGDQVRGLLWHEINGLKERADDIGNPLPGRVNQTEWWIGSYQAGIGRKPSDYKPAAFAGFHSLYPLVVADEADGIPPDMWTSIDALLTNDNARFLGIGNPDDPQSQFRQEQESAEGDPKQAVFVINAWSTPNFTGEPVESVVANSLLGRDWVEDKRIKWGVDHPFWSSKVEAEYPGEDQLTIVRAAWLAAARLDLGDEPDYKGLGGVHQIGVDVSGSESGDKTIVRERHGSVALREWTLEDSSDPTNVLSFLVNAASESGADVMVIDATGVGFGFIASLREKLPRMAISGFTAAAKAHKKRDNGKDRLYGNQRAELHWEVGREYSRKGKWDLSRMDNADETLGQLAVIRHKTVKGVIFVEEKDEIRKRTKRSPDNSDALLLAFAIPNGGGEVAISNPASQQLTSGAAATTRDATLYGQMNPKFGGFPGQSSGTLPVRGAGSFR